MKSTIPLLLLAAALITGCQSIHPVSTDLITGNLDLTIRRSQTWRAWLKDEPGRGFHFDVWTQADAVDYSTDLKSEFEGAAKIFFEMARTKIPQEWDYIELTLTNKYGSGKNLYGSCRVIMRGETLRALHSRGAPVSEYPQHWRFLSAHKDRLDSREAMSWEANPSAGESANIRTRTKE